MLSAPSITFAAAKRPIRQRSIIVANCFQWSIPTAAYVLLTSWVVLRPLGNSEVVCPLSQLGCCGKKCFGKFYRHQRQQHLSTNGKNAEVIDNLLLKIDTLSKQVNDNQLLATTTAVQSTSSSVNVDSSNTSSNKAIEEIDA
eukprot:gene21753-27807_t